MQLVTWNVQWCCGLDGVVSPERIVDTVQAMGEADVVCLQEIAINYPKLQGQPGMQLAQLQALLPQWQLFFGPAVNEWTGAGHQQFGNLIATRLPVLQVQHYPMPYPADANVRTMPRMCTMVTVQDPHLGPVRVMTAHLEYYSPRQRLAQARFLRRTHFEALSHLYGAPTPASDGSPFQTKPHTPHAVLCGDFNFDVAEPEYQAISERAQVIECLEAGWSEKVVGARWNDAWQVPHASQLDTNQPPTFCVHDKKWGSTPRAYDLVWVSDSLAGEVRSFAVDGTTQASDHQPVRVVLGC